MTRPVFQASEFGCWKSIRPPGGLLQCNRPDDAEVTMQHVMRDRPDASASLSGVWRGKWSRMPTTLSAVVPAKPGTHNHMRLLSPEIVVTSLRQTTSCDYGICASLVRDDG